MFINITPLTKYIRELTEYQILIFGIQPNIELFGEYIWSNRILNYSVATLQFCYFIIFSPLSINVTSDIIIQQYTSYYHHNISLKSWLINIQAIQKLWLIAQ